MRFIASACENYYDVYQKMTLSQNPAKPQVDHDREMYMAKRLKELSLSYDRILFVGGMAHVQNVLSLVNRHSFPVFQHADREVVQLCTLTEESCREVMVEYGWMSLQYEKSRQTLVEKGRYNLSSRQAEVNLSTLQRSFS